MKRVALLLCFLSLFVASAQSVASAANATPISPRLHGVGQVLEHSLERGQQSYYLFVRLPEDYDLSDEQYPVVYLLDGGITFPIFAGYLKYLRLSGEVPPVILVGISYGTDDWQQGNARGHDFTLPSPEAEHYGGAEAFDDYLKEELLPFIETRYRVDPARRYIFGQSLGGQFVLYATLHAQSGFAGGIASNPAIHRVLDQFKSPANNQAAKRLFVAFAEHDNPRFARPALEWRHYVESHPPETLVKFVKLPGLNHFSAAPEAFRQGMIWLLND